VGYGATFALASMSCTIELFLAVVAQALAAPGPVGAVAPFLIYGAGMGASVLAVSILAAVAGSSAAVALRSKTPLLMRIGGGLMALAGAYVLVFGLAEVLPRYGIDALNPVLHTTARWQGAVAQWIESWGTVALVVFVVAVAAATVVILVVGRRADARAASRTEGDATAESPSASAGPSRIRVADRATLDALRASVKKD
jgi:hypothetical protein